VVHQLRGVWGEERRGGGHSQSHNRWLCELQAVCERQVDFSIHTYGTEWT
jgi:hypothetical protein